MASDISSVSLLSFFAVVFVLAITACVIWQVEVLSSRMVSAGDQIPAVCVCVEGGCLAYLFVCFLFCFVCLFGVFIRISPTQI